MTDYVKSTTFTSKDSLSTGNPLKIVKGAEFDVEFNAIATAVASKADTNSPTFTGVPSAPTAAAGTNTGQLATTAFVSAASTLIGPSGEIKMWPTGTAPAGYLLCNGQAVSRSTYSALFTVLGTTYGAGDGSTTFNLPDFNNRMPVGAGALYAAGATGGSKDAIVVSHTHTASSAVTDPGHTHTYKYTDNVTAGGPAALEDGNVVNSTATGAINSATTGITVATTINSAGVSGTDANLPPYLGIYFIIKA